jgi:hypothetical protein
MANEVVMSSTVEDQGASLIPASSNESNWENMLTPLTGSSVSPVLGFPVTSLIHTGPCWQCAESICDLDSLIVLLKNNKGKYKNILLPNFVLNDRDLCRFERQLVTDLIIYFKTIMFSSSTFSPADRSSLSFIKWFGLYDSITESNMNILMAEPVPNLVGLQCKVTPPVAAKLKAILTQACGLEAISLTSTVPLQLCWLARNSWFYKICLGAVMDDQNFYGNSTIQVCSTTVVLENCSQATTFNFLQHTAVYRNLILKEAPHLQLNMLLPVLRRSLSRLHLINAPFAVGDALLSVLMQADIMLVELVVTLSDNTNPFVGFTDDVLMRYLNWEDNYILHKL